MALVTVNTQKAQKKLNKVMELIDQQGFATIKDITEMTKRIAQTLAPKETGRTAGLIITRNKKLQDGYSGQVVAQNPTANDGHTRKIKNFNLVKWMHLTNGVFQSFNSYAYKITRGRSGLPGSQHIISGDPRFMYSARDIMKGQGIDIARSNFNKINIR